MLSRTHAALRESLFSQAKISPSLTDTSHPPAYKSNPVYTAPRPS
jgi:hypothetical protein